MGDTNAVAAGIVDSIQDPEDWWKSSSRNTFIECAEELLDAGLSRGVVSETLSSLYYAMCEEYGE